MMVHMTEVIEEISDERKKYSRHATFKCKGYQCEELLWQGETVEETVVSFKKYFCVKEERTFKYHLFFHCHNFI